MKGHLSRPGTSFLLVTSQEPGAELHEGCESIGSGGRQGQMGLQHFLQQCQHLFLFHLQEWVTGHAHRPRLS